MTNSLTPVPKKRISKGKKLTLWIVGSIVGLFVLITAIGAIGLASQPGGYDAAVASQSAEAEAKEREKAKVDAEKAAADDQVKESEDAALDATAAEKKKVDDEVAAKQAEENAAAEAAKNDPMRLIAEASGVKDVVVTQKSGTITATFPIADNLSERLIRVGAQNATVDILRAVSEHAPAKYEKVLVLGGFPMQDAYGNVTEDQKILQAEYEKATIEKINFENFIADRVWEVRDFGLVHKVLRDEQ